MSKSAWKDILEQINKASQVHLTEAERDAFWVIGVSGGADSMALLHGIFSVHKKLVVAHVNYGKRAEASDLDEELVRETCKVLAIPFRSLKAPKHASGNFQASARSIRYDFFETCVQEYDAKLIVLAQHKDDQEENLIFRTLRGSNSKAILGPKVKEGNRFRPLLDLRKQDLVNGLKEQHFIWRDDVSNADSTFARNWLRNDVIPQFTERFPGWQDHLVQKAQFELESILLIEPLVRNDLKWISKDTLSISDACFDLGTPMVLRFLIHHKLNEKQCYISSQALDQVIKLMAHQKGKKIDLNEQWIAIREDKSISVCRKIEEKSTHKTIDSSLVWPKQELDDYQFDLTESLLKVRGVLSIDLDKITFPISIRNWKNGDSINPLGMTGSKLISDVITLAKVPNQIKDQILVLEDFDEVIHAVIFPPIFSKSNRSSELSKVTDQTRTVAQIKPHTI